ncbi:nucleotide exchange factor GrpE [Bacillus sp. HMF5848]|uniref:nucleotide exchange factor GrpE n=1 Tax=Bacillus sp. HMF5848 TaxID=2495421 RepID=UPI000F7A074C|nr:nucleotide exchange factor GrpE [Bacillus sp. HMF5848]RSK27904.1 nucleotide exchange factor GrpE [Bacillus sp. HMF5848]
MENEKTVADQNELENEANEQVDAQVEPSDTNTSDVEQIRDTDTASQNESAQVTELTAKLEETENRLLRLQADFDNYRRRVRLDMEAAEKYRAQSLINDILPALDNFERAMKVEATDDASKSLMKGMEMVYRQLLDALTKEGVEAIQAVGEQFDPHLHQAVMQEDNSDYPANTVIEEFQKGYKLKDRVIRPSMVKVNN